MLKILGRLTLLLVLALSPLAMAASTRPDSGMLISRTSTESWQIRLVADTQAQQFSGVLESSVAFSSVSAVNLEQSDIASLSSADTLGMTLSVLPGRMDGVNFSVSADAKLCLRDTGSVGVQIYLGTSVDDAVPVSAPVALTGADACGATPPPPPPATGRKNHRGHYIALLRGVDSQSVMANSVMPGVVGFMKRYTWRDLEPAQGSYDFSEIQSDLTFAAGQGMRLIVMIEDKTFVLERPTPAYLDAYTLRNVAGGYSVLRWSPFVVDRFKALIGALGQRFDANPTFEGIATQETAHGFSDAQMDANGYTPEKYRDAYINILSHAGAAMPTSRIFWFMNFFARKQSYIADIASAVASRGVVMGGPDIQPDNGALVRMTYPIYDQMQGKIPMFGQVEPSCYSHEHATSAPTKYWTMPELFRFGRDDMHVNYIFWARVPKSRFADSYDWLDALPVIDSNPTINP
jgi:hypothetical protein